jgi:hypothetical protein
VFSLEGVPGGDAVEYTIQKESLERQLGVADLPAMKPLDYASLRPLSIASKRGTPLRIGFYHTDGFVHTTPACYRAMEETLSALHKRYTEDEIEFVPLRKEDVRAVEAMEIFVGLTSAAKYRHLTHPHLAPDALDPTLWVPVYVSRLPAVVRALIGFILLYVLGEKDFAKLGAAAGGKSSEEYFMWVKRREDFRKEWRERVWEGHGLDAIVAYAASDAFGTQGHTLTFPQTDPGVSGSTAQRRQETLTHVHFHGNVQRPRLPRSMSPCHPGRRGQGLSNACTRGGGGFRRGTQDLGSLEFGFRAVKV